jgi:hypothetical protein
MRFAGADEPITAGAASDTVWIDGNTEQAANALKNIVLLKRWYVWKFSSSVATRTWLLGDWQQFFNSVSAKRLGRRMGRSIPPRVALQPVKLAQS